MSIDINGLTGLCVGRRMLQEKTLERMLHMSHFQHLRIPDIPSALQGEKYLIAGVVDQIRHSDVVTMKYFALADLAAGASVHVRVPVDIIKQELKIGLIVILLNPEIVKSATGSIKYVSVTSQLSLLLVGEAAFFGRCKALRKDNTPCTMAIDTSETSRCRYHKHVSQDAILSSASIVLPEKSNERKPKIITEPVSSVTATKCRNHHNICSNSPVPNKQDDLLSMLSPATSSSAASVTLQHVSVAVTDGRVPVPKPSAVFQSATTRPFIQTQRPAVIPLSRNVASSNSRLSASAPAPSTLIRSGGVIFDLAKTRANAKPSAPAEKRPASSIAQADIDALLNRTSSHAEEANDEWHAQFNKKLKSLQHKEAAVEAKSNIEVLHVNAFYCSECKRTSEIVLGYCRQHGHNVTQVRTVKRFFQCQVCQRSDWFLLGASKLPIDPCRICNSNNWKTCSINASAQNARERSTADEKLVLTMSEGTSRRDAMRIKTVNANLDRSAL